jgi:hypothetical protein
VRRYNPFARRNHGGPVRVSSPVRHLPFLVLAALALLANACEPYDKPRRPLPTDFQVQLLDGPRLGPEQLLGKPWVIHLWVPR